jgi:hypothetical protein
VQGVRILNFGNMPHVQGFGSIHFKDTQNFLKSICFGDLGSWSTNVDDTNL